MRRGINATTLCLTSSGKNRNYLKGLVGSKASMSTVTTSSDTPATVKPSLAMPSAPLMLTGSSYLIPTLRLDRRDDAVTLQTKLRNALSSSSFAKGIHSMLRRKPSRTWGQYQWSVPIVLDLAALVPDGSHHYVTPKQGLLTGVVKTLLEFGIVVVGVTNSPHELELEAIQQLGLPLFVTKGVTNRSTLKVGLDYVIHMVLKKREEFCNDDVENSVEEAGSLVDFRLTTEPPSHKETELLSQVAPVEKSSDSSFDENQPQIPTNSYVYFGSVRSGQQVAADKGQALVVIGSVNSGGEVLSDGDIYVFGKLRGRALAGLASAQDAKIITTSFDPELISIGDIFTTVDDVSQFGLKQAEVAAMVTLSSTGSLIVKEITV